MEINLESKHVTWMVNESPFYLARIPSTMLHIDLYPCIVLNNHGDEI